MPTDGPTEIQRRLAAVLHPVVVAAFVDSHILNPADVSVDEIAALLAKEVRRRIRHALITVLMNMVASTGC